jgi:hypothetical protein
MYSVPPITKRFENKYLITEINAEIEQKWEADMPSKYYVHALCYIEAAN